MNDYTDEELAGVEAFDLDTSNLTMKPVLFKCDDELFECAPVGMLPAGATRDLAQVARADKNQQVVLFGAFLDSVLLPESAARFSRRLRDPVKPITDKQVSNIIIYLVRKYGGRPTTPVSPLPNGAGTGGTS